MNKMFFAVSGIVLAVLLVFSGTVIAYEGEKHEEKYEEGSGGAAMEMDHKAGGHKYKGEHGEGMEHSKEYYEKKYGKKYDHEKHELKEEGSGMKDSAQQMMREEHPERKEEGSKM
jgi:hypothetical protein